MSNEDFKELIRQSAEESANDMHGSDADHTSGENTPLFAFPGLAISAWLICSVVTLALYFNPLADRPIAGARSSATMLSIAVYHAAHRVETYRQFTGNLPDYFDPAWQESKFVRYDLSDDRTSYVLTGQSGGLTIVYRQGDNPEKLLHFDETFNLNVSNETAVGAP